MWLIEATSPPPDYPHGPTVKGDGEATRGPGFSHAVSPHSGHEETARKVCRRHGCTGKQQIRRRFRRRGVGCAGAERGSRAVALAPAGAGVLLRCVGRARRRAAGIANDAVSFVGGMGFRAVIRRLRMWLYGHPRFGPTLVAWHEHRAVPRRAKAVAVTLMALSLAYVSWTAAHPIVPIAVGLTMTCAAAFLLTRPDAPPPSS